MLQRSYRCSFASNLPRIGTGVLYSNISFGDDPFEIPGIARITPSISPLPCSCYTVDWPCHSPPPKLGVPNTPLEIVFDQLRLVICFALNALFSPRPDDIIRFTSSPPSSGEMEWRDTHPTRFIRRIFSHRLRGGEKDIENLCEFMAKLLALPRAIYTTVIRCLAAREHALLVVHERPDLTYTLLVACLEALTQDLDNFSPSWTVYPKEHRAKIESLAIAEDTLSELKSILLQRERGQLSARTVKFVSEHLPDSFFESQADDQLHDLIPRLPRSLVASALLNAYNLRSRYAHQLLAPMNAVIMGGGPRGEIINAHTSQGEMPLPTIRGLERILRQVTLRVVQKGPFIEEAWDADTAEELPGSISRIYPPDYWLNNTDQMDSSAECANTWFRGLLRAYEVRILNRPKTPEFLGLGPGGTAIMEPLPGFRPDAMKIGLAAERQMNGAGKETKKVLWAIRVLCGAPLPPTGQCPGCKAELLAAVLICQDSVPFPWDISDVESTVDNHLNSPQVVLPELVSAAMAVTVANSYHERGDLANFDLWLKRARDESPSHPEIQVAIVAAAESKEKVPVISILPSISELWNADVASPPST